MINTNETLLDRLRTVQAHDAWQEFYKAYWSAILRYARKLGLNEHQSHDVLQETMVALMRILPDFQYDRRKGKFRNFLLTIVHRKSLTALRRAKGVPDVSLDSDDPWGRGALHDILPAAASEADATEAQQRWRESLVEEALARLRADESIEPRTLQIFQAYVIDNQAATAVAAEFGVQENTVYQIKNRLLRRVQVHLARLMRDSGAPE
jgi:RNA polymerase sigma factor (sigma-70 family)